MRMRFRAGALILLSFAGCEPGSERQGPLAPRTGDDLRDEVIYQVVTDRFANGDRRNDELEGAVVDPQNLAHHQGGDFAGVLEHLDYIEELGATTLWLSPVVANVPRQGEVDGYHGYWASDFTRINPRFGTLAELRALVGAAHARGMKVLLDVVVNHTGQVFFYDLNANGKVDAGEQEPGYREDGYGPLSYYGAAPRLWRQDAQGKVEAFSLTAEHFHLRGLTQHWSSPEEVVLGDFPTGLRDLATSSAPVMQALIDTYAEWIRLTDVDGFRLDAAPHMAHADWARFCTGVRARARELGKPTFYLLGEVFRGNPRELAAYTQAGEFDAVFDFTLKWDGIDRYLLEGGSPLLARAALESARVAYPARGQEGGVGLSPWQARVTFGDNHDVARMRGRLDDGRAVALALTLLLTADGIPALYYGTEQGFKGQGGHASREVLWASGFDIEAAPYRFIAALTRLRQEHAALRRGDLIVRYAAAVGGRGTGLDDTAEDATDPDEMQDPYGSPPAVPVPAPVPGELPDDAGILAFERVYASERILVVLNGTADRERRARITTGFAEGQALRDLLGDSRVLRVGARGELEVSVPRRAALVLTVRE